MNRSILKQQLTNGHVYRLNKKIKSVSCNYHIYKIESYPIPLLQNGFEDMFCECPQKITMSFLRLFYVFSSTRFITPIH